MFRLRCVTGANYLFCTLSLDSEHPLAVVTWPRRMQLLPAACRLVCGVLPLPQQTFPGRPAGPCRHLRVFGRLRSGTASSTLGSLARVTKSAHITGTMEKRVSLAITTAMSLCLGVALLLMGFIVPIIIDNHLNDSLKQSLVVSSTDSVGYERWERDTQDDAPAVFYKFYFFHIKNPKEVLQGGKPDLLEKGPYVYRRHKVRDTQESCWHISRWNLTSPFPKMGIRSNSKPGPTTSINQNCQMAIYTRTTLQLSIFHSMQFYPRWTMFGTRNCFSSTP